MPSPNKKTIKAYLTTDEHQRLTESAAKAGLSVSTFVKRVCLSHNVHSTVDHQAVLSLIRANADLGRLGGLFKMFLSEGKAGQHAEELRATLRSIEAAKDQITKEYNTVIREFTRKKSRGPGQ